ncbi:MAG: hypothetical protein IK124_10080, partial [Prevotella sp.]|nr:hypothetical protein [Prevotella sp.]
RFLSPDPIIQSPDFSQSLNRYAYCLNNPLSLVDPSGYSWFSKNWKSLTAAAVGIAVNVLVAGGATGFTISVIAGAAGGAAGAMTGALLNGANLGQVAKATFTGAFWGAVGGAANFASYDDNLFASLFKHAFTESAQETLKGGNMLHGFMMGLVSGIGAATINKYKGQIGRVGCIVANAVTCGTVSEIGGGKFANGAVTGAFSIMFNDFMHSIKFKNIDFKAVKDELDKLYEKYGSAEENSSLYRSMGGSIKSEVYDKYYELTGNACALKLSKALRRVGYYIEKGTKGSLTDKHGNAYFVSAEIMQEYLSGIPEAHTMNYNNVIDLRNNLNTGFFFQKGGYTNPNIGHIDVVYNRQFPKRLGNAHKQYVGIY